MKSHFYHTQLNINFKKNGEFYKKLFAFLGWKIIFTDHEVAGFRSGENGDMWFYEAPKKGTADYDGIGMNHVAIRVGKQKDVDETIKFLKTKKIKTLFGTPRHRPEFAHKEGETYYQIIFESPDKIQIEVVYIGLKK